MKYIVSNILLKFFTDLIPLSGEKNLFDIDLDVSSLMSTDPGSTRVIYNCQSMTPRFHYQIPASSATCRCGHWLRVEQSTLSTARPLAPSFSLFPSRRVDTRSTLVVVPTNSRDQCVGAPKRLRHYPPSPYPSIPPCHPFHARTTQQQQRRRRRWQQHQQQQQLRQR